jgi:8-oxo-dGTP pyrophosphatase MutT (NUDIX family)
MKTPSSTIDQHWAPVRLRAAIYIEYQDQVLLVYDPVYRGGCWTLPGGAAEFGETIVQAAERETLEETGLKVRVHSLWRIREIWEPENDYLDQPDTMRKTLEMIFIGDYLSGAIDVTTDPSHKADGIPRVQACRWFPLYALQLHIDGVPLYPVELSGPTRPSRANSIPLEHLLLPSLNLEK